MSIQSLTNYDLMLTMKLRYVFLSIAFLSFEASADSSTLDAAIGGGIGGAAGAAIGNELGGRDGAIVGGALGGAVGTALNTEGKSRDGSSPRIRTRHYAPQPRRPRGPGFCPPGLAMQGRC